MRNTKVVISIGKSVFTNKIVQKQLTIDKLFDKLSRPQIRNKKDGQYFIFASISGNERNAKSVKYYYGATLDLDKTEMLPKDIRKVLKPLGCWYVIYTTFNHKIKGNRYRVVIPYADPVSKGKHVETTIFLNSMFGIDGVDTSSKALSRPMYFPSCPEKTKEEFYFYESRSTKLFNPDKKVKLEPHQLWALEQMQQQDKEKVDITAEIVEGDRNNHIAQIAGTLIHQGKTLVDVMDYCDEVNQLKLSPPLSDKDIKTIVTSVWKSHARNHDDCDWGFSQIRERIHKDEDVEANLDHIIGIIANSVKNKKTSAVQQDKLLNLIKKRTGDSIVTLRKEVNEKIRINTDSPPDELDQSEVDEPFINKIRNEFEDYYLVTSSNIIYNRKFDLSYKIEGFNNTYSYLQQDFSSFKVSPFRILQQIGCMNSVDKVDYHPGKEKMFKDHVGMHCLNTYNKPKIIPVRGRTKILRSHFDYLFSNDEDRNIVLDFIAFNYQYPGVKVRWMPVIKGKKRIGKSLIGNKIVAPIFGSNNIRQLGNSMPLLEKFNGWQTGTQMVIIHELFISNRLDQKQLVTENIKSFVTDEFLSVRRMHSDGVQTLNTTNGMAFTNHEDALYVTDDEERFCMIRCEVQKRSPAYYEKLVDYLDNNQSAIANYFNTRKINFIDPNSLPNNEYTKEVMQSSLNWAEDIVKEAIVYRNDLFVKRRALTWTTICDHVIENTTESDIRVRKIDQIYNMGSSQGRMLKQALIEAGFRMYKYKNKDRFKIDGKLDRIWVTKYGKNKGTHSNHPDIVRKFAIDSMKLKEKARFKAELEKQDEYK